MSIFYDDVPATYGPAEPKQPQSQLEARVEALEQRVEQLEKAQTWLRQPYAVTTSFGGY